MGKKSASSSTVGGATSGKERASGWSRSKFTSGDLRKLRKYGLLPTKTEAKIPDDEVMPQPEEGWRDHIFLSCLPPLPEGGEISEVAADTEGGVPEAATGQDTAKADEDATFELSHTATSIPPANSQDDEAKGKRKRSDDDEDSDSLSASKPRLVVPISSDAPASSFAPPNLFYLALDLSSDEEETPKAPSRDETRILSAFIKAPAKMVNPQEETVESPKSEEVAESPQAPPNKKSKKDTANKGITISENPTVPSMDDVTALKKSEKHAKELEAKLKAAEEALGDARAKAKAEEEKLAEEKSQMATREADIRLRLDALTASFIKKVGDLYEMPEDQKTDPLLDSLTMLEANSVWVRNVLVHARRAFKRLFGHFFPRKKEPEDLLDLANVFTAKEDPALNYRRAATKTGVEIAMAMSMAHGENVNWEKPLVDDWVDPELASGPSLQESMPEGPNTFETADQSSELSSGTGGTHRFEELQSELKILKDQIVVALLKAKRAAEREDYLLILISRASDDLLCAQLNSVTEEERVKARMNALMEISAETGSDF
ncbi:hypothetical protein ACQ4PT_028891 [Festuca glaucescens]